MFHSFQFSLSKKDFQAFLLNFELVVLHDFINGQFGLNGSDSCLFVFVLLHFLFDLFNFCFRVFN